MKNLIKSIIIFCFLIFLKVFLFSYDTRPNQELSTYNDVEFNSITASTGTFDYVNIGSVVTDTGTFSLIKAKNSNGLKIFEDSATKGIFIEDSGNIIITGELTGMTSVQATIGDFDNIYVSSIHAKSPLYIFADTAAFNNGIESTYLNTGQGNNELYDMDQNVLTTSSTTFAQATISGSAFIGNSGVIDGAIDIKASGVSKVKLDSVGDGYYLGGNIGIGTDTTTEKLEVYNGNIKTNYGVSATTGVFTEIYVSTINPQSNIFFNNETNDVLFTGSGRVAIGSTTIPDVLGLYVCVTDHSKSIVRFEDIGVSSGYIDFFVDDADYNTLRFTDSGDNFWKVKSGGSNRDFRLESNTTDYFIIKSTGNIGLEVTNPANKLDINGEMAIGENYVGVKIAPANGAIIEGNVGIGITNVTEKLDISGNIKTTGDIIISSRPLANQSWLLNLSSTTQITADVYTVMCGTSVLNSDSAWFTLVTDEQGNQNRLTYVGANTHKFYVSLNACLSDTAVSATTSKIQIYKNGAGTGKIATQYYPVQDKVESSSLSQIISLATNNFIEVYATTDDGDNLNSCQIQLNVIPID